MTNQRVRYADEFDEAIPAGGVLLRTHSAGADYVVPQHPQPLGDIFNVDHRQGGHMNRVSLCIAVALAGAPTLVMAQELAPDVERPQSAVMTPAEPDPALAAARITAALKTAKGVPQTGITVATHAGTVTLSGEVNSNEEMVAVRSVAEKAAEGVRIFSSISVKPMEDRPIKDQQVAQQSAQLVSDVEAALKADSRTANLGIAVTTSDAKVVVLQGLVPTAENRSVVQTVAAKVKGVARVDNRVQVPGK